MVKKIRTMHLQEKSFVDENILKLPVLGDLSIRQLAYISIPALIVYKLASPLGIFPLATLLFLTFGFSLFIAKKPIKAFKPEEQLYLLLTKQPIREKKKRREEKVRISEEIIEAPPAEYVEKNETILITGILRDPSTGSPIPNAPIQIYVNGEQGPTIRTDSKGAYRLYYSFAAKQNTLELVYNGQVLARKQIIVK